MNGTGEGAFQPLAEDDPRQIARYRLAARLGAGGMGKVYFFHTPGGRPVAIKVIRPEFAEDPEFRRRFAQEVRAAERVQGLYTAPVIDSDTDGPHPWLATAYVSGPTLAAAVAEHGPRPHRPYDPQLPVDGRAHPPARPGGHGVKVAVCDIDPAWLTETASPRAQGFLSGVTGTAR
ncbi:hypothetical protein ABT314_33845, partial [Streptomyces spiralis]